MHEKQVNHGDVLNQKKKKTTLATDHQAMPKDEMHDVF